MDLPLDDGLEILLHLRSGDLDVGGQGIFGLTAVDIRAVDGDLVVLHLVHTPRGNELAGGVFAGPELHLHIRLADDLALEGGGKGYGDGQLLDLDLDVAQGQGVLGGLIVAQNGLQRSGDLEITDVLVHDDGETQGNGARSGGDDHLVEGPEGVDKGGDALLGILEQAGQVACLDVAEDQRSADGDGDDVDDAGDVVAKGHHAQLQPHLHPLARRLLDAVADHKGEDALGLVVLDHLGYICGVVRLADDHGHAGDIAGDKGHTQGADDGVRDKADAGVLCIGVAAPHIFQALDDLRAHGGGKPGVQRLGDVVLVGDQALEDAHAGGQVAQGFHLHAGGGVDGGEEVGGVGESNRGVGAVLGNRVVDGPLSQACNGIGTGIDQVS